MANRNNRLLLPKRLRALLLGALVVLAGVELLWLAMRTLMEPIRRPEGETVKTPRLLRALPYLSVFSTVLALAVACAEPRPAEEPTVAEEAAAEELLHPASEAAAELKLDRVWSGDFGGMAERRVIRALVPYSQSFYFLDRGVQHGITYEMMKLFEKQVNKELATGRLGVHVVIIPTSRDRLLPALAEGKGDIAAGNLTVIPERRELVDFSDPFATGVREILVTGPAATPLTKQEDVAGRAIYVRRSSSYYESLLRLNAALEQSGLSPTILRPAEEILEDEDLLEMVDAGLVPMVVVDQHKAELWVQVFDRITLHRDFPVRTGGEIAWAFRKGSPELAEVVNRFVARHKQGSLLFNVITRRYLENAKWVKNAVSGEEMKRFEETVGLFRKYAPQYGFDHLMMIAQGYQESGLDQSVRSRAGAVGIMQLLPSTAESVGVHDFEQAEPNVHAGIKYMRWILDHYFDDDDVDDLNKTLFAFASYNAGPNRIARLRRQAGERGLDPDVWFRNVEIVVADKVGSEPVRYVSNIYKYYAAYRLVAEQEEWKAAVRGGP